MTIAVVIVHGMGEQKQGFSMKLQKGIANYYQHLGADYSRASILFQEIFWGDVLKEQQATLFQRLGRDNRLDYHSLRHFFINYLGDVIAYQPISSESSDASPFRDEIHRALREGLASFMRLKGFSEETPLVLIGHSLGSVIMFNYIWDQQMAEASSFIAGHSLAGFVTLGSPLALWTLRYPGFGRPIRFPGQSLADTLSGHAKWINIFDRDDIIAYPLKSINKAFNETVAEDIEINVGSMLTSWNPLSHDGYFDSASVHKEVAQLLKGISDAM